LGAFVISIAEFALFIQLRESVRWKLHRDIMLAFDILFEISILTIEGGNPLALLHLALLILE